MNPRPDVRPRRRAGWWLTLGLLLPAAVVAEPSDAAMDQAAQLLARLAAAPRLFDYEGTLVYLHENRLETLHLIHRVAPDGIRERLLSLNGPVRSVSREANQTICALPDGHPRLVRRPAPGQGWPRIDGIDPRRLADYYRIELSGPSRVAGRATEVFAVTPRDDLRYGYRFHLDHETALPLKFDLIDGTGAALEQIMFTHIAYSPVAAAAPAASPAPRPMPMAPPERWQFDTRPAGFQLVMYHRLPPSEGAVEHFLFSDQLAAYSIYIESAGTDGLDGAAWMGAVHAAGRQLGGHRITAVGEVPAATVAAAVAGMRLVQSP